MGRSRTRQATATIHDGFDSENEGASGDDGTLRSPPTRGEMASSASQRSFNDNSPKRRVDTSPDNGESLKSYSNRLQQVVMQQHTARREDWGHFHAREAALLEEIGELRRYAEDRDSMRWYEAKLVEELRLERRKRIDLEARLTGADRWRTEAIAAGRMARNAEVNMSFGQEAELAEAREWQRNAERFRAGEERAMATERLAEDSLRRSRQELGRKSRDLEKRSAEVELRSEASEAEALASAFRLSAELRNELDAVKTNTSGARQIGGQPSPGRPVSQARRALEDIRGVRERVDGMLSGYPM